MKLITVQKYNIIRGKDVETCELVWENCPALSGTTSENIKVGDGDKYEKVLETKKRKLVNTDFPKKIEMKSKRMKSSLFKI